MWIKNNNQFRPRPSGSDSPALPAGAYNIEYDMFGPYLAALPLVTDNLIILPGAPMAGVLTRTRKFWNSAALYAANGLVHKRGVLLYGAPGGGKTVVAQMLAASLIADGGIVAFPSDLGTALEIGQIIRGQEPTRPITIVLEDIERYIKRGGEEELTQVLDGQNSIASVCYIATTNFLDQLPPRLVNRPSRFDEVVEIGMPNEASQIAYLESLGLSGSMAALWAGDTTDLSIAHLKELYVAVSLLGADYKETVVRLRALATLSADAGPDVSTNARQAASNALISAAKALNNSGVGR